jgi:hypothetical protein
MTYDDLMDGRAQQFALEDAAEEIRVRNEARTAFAQRAAWEARHGTIDTSATMYTSEPLPDRQSVFFSMDGRYWASAEDARRQDLDLAAAEAAELAIERAAAQAEEEQHAAARHTQRAA